MKLTIRYMWVIYSQYKINETDLGYALVNSWYEDFEVARKNYDILVENEDYKFTLVEMPIFEREVG